MPELNLEYEKKFQNKEFFLLVLNKIEEKCFENQVNTAIYFFIYYQVANISR